MQTSDINSLTVDVLVTWRCNLRCKKCAVPKEGIEAPLTLFEQTLEKLYAAGVRRIVLTGGDPLVRDETPDIARYAHDKGFKVFLSTNGICLQQRWNDLSPWISWVSISLDCGTADSNERMTGPGGALQFDRVTGFLRFYRRQSAHPVKIKLATVITKKNAKEIPHLGRLIFEEQEGYRPDVWRLYQFSGQFSDDPLAANTGANYIGEHSVSLEEAETLIKCLRRDFPKVEISFRTAESRDESFIFLSPNLELTYPLGRKYIPFGDAKAMSADDLRLALFGVSHLWKKIIQNRQLYT